MGRRWLRVQARSIISRPLHVRVRRRFVQTIRLRCYRSEQLDRKAIRCTVILRLQMLETEKNIFEASPLNRKLWSVPADGQPWTARVCAEALVRECGSRLRKGGQSSAPIRNYFARAPCRPSPKYSGGAPPRRRCIFAAAIRRRLLSESGSPKKKRPREAISDG